MTDTDTQLRDIWKSKQEDDFVMQTEVIYAHAMRLDRKIWLRNAVELIAGAIAIAAFTWYFLASDSSWQKTGSALILLGVVFALVNLHFRAGAGRPDTSRDCRSYYIAELVRQRDALRSLALWYLLPLVPGLIVFETGTWFSSADSERALRVGFWLGCLGLFAFAAWTSQRQASRFQQQIDEARALQTGRI